MKKLAFKIKNVKLVFAVLVILLFALILLYYNFIFSKVFAKNQFANEMIEISEENENSIFNIQKLIVYSSANAIDNSKDQSLQNVDICQYSDISIFIDNTSTISELTDENTVKELYIDDIVITSNADMGNKILNYKNPLTFGSYKDVEEPTNNRIDFNIINTNSENESNDYANPTFYTDCSNPITLGYLNKNLAKHSVSDASSTITFNGKVLQEANINLDDINYNLSFKIHIVNNLNEKFVYNMSLNVDLNGDNGGIYNGYTYKGTTTSGDEYRFFKQVK